MISPARANLIADLIRASKAVVNAAKDGTAEQFAAAIRKQAEIRKQVERIEECW